MRVTVTILLALLVVCLPGRNEGRAQDRPGSVLDRILRSSELRIGTTGDYPPYTERKADGGGYGGLDIEMARRLAASLDATPVFVPTTWPTLMDDLAAGRFDIGMGGISRTLARQRAAYFSKPYQHFGKTPIARCADRDRFDSLARIDQPGVRVIVNPGGTNEAFAREHIRRATLIVHPDNRTIFAEIANGRADVMITDSVEVIYQHRIDPALCGTMPGQTFTRSEKAYLMPQDITWKLYVDAWLDELRLRGELEQLLQATFGE